MPMPKTVDVSRIPKTQGKGSHMSVNSHLLVQLSDEIAQRMQAKSQKAVSKTTIPS